jgi:hypothetical protein
VDKKKNQREARTLYSRDREAELASTTWHLNKCLLNNVFPLHMTDVNGGFQTLSQQILEARGNEIPVVFNVFLFSQYKNDVSCRAGHDKFRKRFWQEDSIHPAHFEWKRWRKRADHRNLARLFW